MMDKTADGWRLRLLAEIRKQTLSYRELSERCDMNYSTVHLHLTGKAKYESLWFVRRICRGTGISMPYILFGIDDTQHEINQVPVLTGKAINEWISGEPQKTMVKQWLPYPTMLTAGLRVFVWPVQSSDLAPEWPVSSWLYVDPDNQPETEDHQRRLVLAQLKNGYIVRYLEWLAGEPWLVPKTEIHQACLLGDGRLLGTVIGGLRSVDL